MYWVFLGLHDKIQLSFLVVGHTKFSPDGYFGLIKRHYRRSQVYTYEQLAHIIESSSKNSHNVCIRVSPNQTSSVIYRDWSSWLSPYFETIKGISNYHHFIIERQNPSILIVKERKDSEEFKIKLTKEKFPDCKSHFLNQLPKQIFPKGLSLKRQWYLYEQIRYHIPFDKDKNQTCPKPNIPKSNIKS